MSISSELNALNSYILDAYSMIDEKGGIVPEHQNMYNLFDAIDSIPSGSAFSGIPKEVNANGIYGPVLSPLEFRLPSNARNIVAYCFYYAFRNSTGITKLDFSPITTLTGEYALYGICNGASNLTSIDFSNLATITSSSMYTFQSAFAGCSKLTSVSFPSLTSIAGSNAFTGAFGQCTGITSVSFPELTSITTGSVFSQTFRNCSNLSSVSFPKLNTISANGIFSLAFSNCSKLKTLSFPSLTTSSFGSSVNQFNNMLSGVTGCTLHFPQAVQSNVQSLTGYSAGFGGTNTTILFDL